MFMDEAWRRGTREGWKPKVKSCSKPREHNHGRHSSEASTEIRDVEKKILTDGNYQLSGGFRRVHY